MKSFIKEHFPATPVFNDDENANCYVCPETEGNRGVSKLVTCLIIAFALQKAKLGMENIFSFKYNLLEQYRNRPIVAAMIYTVIITLNEVFFMCFLEKGHTENANDEIRSLI